MAAPSDVEVAWLAQQVPLLHQGSCRPVCGRDSASPTSANLYHAMSTDNLLSVLRRAACDRRVEANHEPPTRVPARHRAQERPRSGREFRPHARFWNRKQPEYLRRFKVSEWTSSEGQRPGRLPQWGFVTASGQWATRAREPPVLAKSLSRAVLRAYHLLWDSGHLSQCCEVA